MSQRIRELVGAEFPLFAFSHCRDVVVAVSRAGGFGVLGGSSFTPETLQEELNWIDAHIEGHPYGVDILIPENLGIGAGLAADAIADKIPTAHIDFTRDILASAGIEVDGDALVNRKMPSVSPEMGDALLDVAFQHPIKLIVNALGIAPPGMIARARAAGVPIGALVGAREHAVRQARAGVDLIIAQGTEAGGHCGEVSTLVLVPEVIRAVAEHGAPPVLAAGGIMTGAQMAACVAMGAAGAWTGSIWLATPEAETSEAFRAKMIAATSRDTVRSPYRTGKPCRQLKSSWFDAWHGPDSPGPLGMPFMGMISTPAFKQIESAAQRGNGKANELVSYFVGQGVGLVEQERSATAIVQEFKEDYLAAFERLGQTLT